MLYLVDLFKNPSLPEGADGRVLWLVLLIVAAPFSMPVYWWQHLRPGSASFARRTSAVTA
ncbi:hypothetical protein [Solicola sp. PLA-1-18]|uniref:hypothetical protein n=1 Tax=Solicola sp. PLA-1-18 TaxID=3380532 RepID=UPI003B78C005